MTNYWMRERVNATLKMIYNQFAQIQRSLLTFVESGYWLVPITWGLVIISISPRFGSAYSPDSFGYYLIGSNFVAGLGYVSQAIRDFYLHASPDFFQSSRSFPPLMPILIGITDALTGKGITSGLLVNIFVLLAMFHVHFLLSKQIASRYFWVVFLTLPIFIFNNDSGDSIVAEIVTGRAIPLSGLLLIGVALTICNEEVTKRRSFILGILLALMYLNRFDALVFCAFTIGYLAFKKHTNLRWVIYGLVLVVTPWLFRNLITFGNPFATDNSITAISTYPSIAQISWFENHIPLLRDDPNLWATQRVSYLITNIKIFIGLFSQLGGFLTIVISALGLLLPNIPSKIKSFNVIAWLWLLTNLITVSLTPYHDARYFSLSVYAIGVSAMLTILAALMRRSGKQEELSEGIHADYSIVHKLQWKLIVITLLLTILLANYFVRSKISAGDTNATGYRQIYNEFKNEVAENDLVAYSLAENLAYYSKWRTIYLPLNCTDANADFISWKSKWNVRYAILPEGSSIGKHPQVVVKKRALGAILVDLKNLVNDEFVITDDNWTYSIARRFAWFLVPNTQAFIDQYKAGRFVIFPDGESRVITRVEPSGRYLNIYFDGNPLDPGKVGMPTKLVVVDRVGHNSIEQRK